MVLAQSMGLADSRASLSTSSMSLPQARAPVLAVRAAAHEFHGRGRVAGAVALAIYLSSLKFGRIDARFRCGSVVRVDIRPLRVRIELSGRRAMQ